MKKKDICCLVGAIGVCIFSLYYMHMDSSLFWTAPYQYLSVLDFPYMIIASLELGMLNLGLPIIAILCIPSMEEPSTHTIMLCWRRSVMRSFIVLLVAFSFFTISSFILTSPIGNSGWQRVGKNGAYQWRVDNEYIFVYIVECFGRLILSLIFWTTVGLGFFVLLGGTNNRFQVCSIVCLSSAIISICSVHMGLQEFDLAFLQIPSVSNKIPLSRLLFRQVVYVAISIVWIAITLIIQKIRQTRRNWINEAQNRALYYVLLVIVSPLLSTFVRNMNYNDSNLFLYVFGGIEWGHPNVFITDCIGWVVLYLPVLCILENKRSKINRKLTYREGMGISVLCSLGMFLTVIILNVLNDGHFEKVILSNDICIETIIVLLLAFFWFVLHMNIISSIYVTLSNWFDSELIGIATQLTFLRKKKSGDL